MAYVQESVAAYAEQVRQRQEKQLQRRARKLGYELKKVSPPSAETEPTAVPEPPQGYALVAPGGKKELAGSEVSASGVRGARRASDTAQ